MVYENGDRFTSFSLSLCIDLLTMLKELIKVHQDIFVIIHSLSQAKRWKYRASVVFTIHLAIIWRMTRMPHRTFFPKSYMVTL